MSFNNQTANQDCVLLKAYESESEVAQSFWLCDPMDWSLAGSSIHGIFQGKSSGVGFHCLLQGIFPTQGSNPGILSYGQMLLPSEPPGKSLECL